MLKRQNTSQKDMMKVQAMNGKSKKLANMFQTCLTCLKIRFIHPCFHVNICVKKDQNNRQNEK